METTRNGDRKFLLMVAVASLIFGGGGATVSRAMWPGESVKAVSWSVAELNARVAVLEERSNHITQSLALLNLKLDRLIERNQQ